MNINTKSEGKTTSRPNFPLLKRRLGLLEVLDEFNEITLSKLSRLFYKPPPACAVATAATRASDVAFASA